MHKLSAAIAFFAMLLTGAGWAQQAMPRDAKPVFDVVTVKPTPPEERGQGFDTHGRHVVITRESVLSMMMFAYGIHPKQVVDAPDWVSSQTFDVDGIPDVAGEPNLQQFQSLLKQLLADRFGLKLHPGSRELSYYSLRVTPGGAKIAKTEHKEEDMPDQDGHGGPGGQVMTFTNNSMAEFALGMQYFVDRPLLNETGLTGRYDFTLHWMPDRLKTPDGDSSPGLFTALREQLGLEFKAAKGPVPVLVVDAVQKPGAN